MKAESHMHLMRLNIKRRAITNHLNRWYEKKFPHADPMKEMLKRMTEQALGHEINETHGKTIN